MNAENIKNEAYQLIDKYFMPAKAIIVKDFLNTYGFWDAPASTKYHGNYPGGLAEHSLAVAKNLMMLTEKLDLKWDNSGSPFIVGLLHDVCKMVISTFIQMIRSTVITVKSLFVCWRVVSL